MSRLRAKLPPINPLLLAGLLLLLTGIGMLVVNLGWTSTGEEGPSLGRRAMSGAIEMAQNAILAGDRALTDTQVRFNSVVMAVLVDGLTPPQRRAAETVASLVGTVFRALFSPLGVLTIVALGAAYVPLARTLDTRLALERPSRSGEQGEIDDADDQ